MNNIAGNNSYNYEEKYMWFTMVFQNIWENILPLHMHLFWITVWVRNRDLISYFHLNYFNQMPYFKKEPKKCPSGVCHLSEVIFYSLLIYPERCFSFPGNLHLALYQALICTSVPNTAVTLGISKLWLIFHLGVLIFFCCH